MSKNTIFLNRVGGASAPPWRTPPVDSFLGRGARENLAENWRYCHFGAFQPTFHLIKWGGSLGVGQKWRFVRKENSPNFFLGEICWRRRIGHWFLPLTSFSVGHPPFFKMAAQISDKQLTFRLTNRRKNWIGRWPTENDVRGQIQGQIRLIQQFSPKKKLGEFEKPFLTHP